MAVEVDDFLAHYGVRGMRWGKRKSKGSSEPKHGNPDEEIPKKATKRATVSGSSVTPRQLHAEMKSLGVVTKPMQELYTKGSDRADQLIEQAGAKPKERKKLTKAQKYAIAGGIVAVSALAVYGAYKYQDISTRNARAGERISINNFRDNSSMASLSYGYNPISKQKFSAMDTKEVHIPKGTVFKRITADPKEDLSGMTYAAFTKADADRYAGLFGPIVRKRSGTNKLYQTHIELNAPVRSPSEKGRVQILIDLVKEDSGLRKQFTNTYSDTSSGTKLSAEDLVLNSYSSFTRSLAARDAVSDAYIKKIKSMGYNALIDDNNAKQIADAPIILLGVDKMLSQINASELTRSLERAARRRLTEVVR